MYMIPGEIVRFTARPSDPEPEMGIFLGEYVSVNKLTGEEYVCAEVMWFHNNEIRTASYSVLEVVREAA
jgi:hypothetical protein